MLELGDIDGKVNPTLWAGEPGKTMRHIEDGLTMGAGKLDLGGINAMSRYVWGQRRRRSRRRKKNLVVGPTHELRRQHLGQLAGTGRAGELGDPWRHGQNPMATGATNLYSSRYEANVRLVSERR